MKELNYIIGKNLNNIRKSLGLNLDKVSELTGVSKSMLGQIERGESNPTVSILWKIANGLQVTFAALIDEQKVKPSLIQKKNIEPIYEVNDDYMVYPYLSFDTSRKFELFLIKLEPNSEYVSQPHSNATEEYVMMIDGEIEVVVNGESFSLEKGDVLHFNVTFPHKYYNKGQTVATAYTLITYP